jgi:hypothetical protein
MNKVAVVCIFAVASIVGLAIIPKSVNSSPKVTDWSKLEANMETLLSKAPTPPSTGNTLTDSYGSKSDCHQMSIQKNNEGRTVKQWACWSEK